MRPTRSAERGARNKGLRVDAVGGAPVPRFRVPRSALRVLRSPDPAARAAALAWLGEHDPHALTAEHAHLLRDPDVEVCAAAVVAFRASPDPALANGARLALRELILGDREARHAGLRAAAQLASPFLLPRLLTHLQHPDPETRRLTLLAAAAVPAGLVTPALLEAAAATALTDLDPGVREAGQALLATVEQGMEPERA